MPSSLEPVPTEGAEPATTPGIPRAAEEPTVTFSRHPSRSCGGLLVSGPFFSGLESHLCLTVAALTANTVT